MDHEIAPEILRWRKVIKALEPAYITCTMVSYGDGSGDIPTLKVWFPLHDMGGNLWGYLVPLKGSNKTIQSRLNKLRDVPITNLGNEM